MRGWGFHFSPNPSIENTKVSTPSDEATRGLGQWGKNLADITVDGGAPFITGLIAKTAFASNRYLRCRAGKRRIEVADILASPTSLFL